MWSSGGGYERPGQRRARVPGPAVHVERTGDPALLRWVCHQPGLGEPGVRWPGPSDVTPLARLVHDGALVGVRVLEGDLLVTASCASRWASLAPVVHDAILLELTELPGWLTKPPESFENLSDRQPVPPTIADVQAEVDQAAGVTAASHGGLIEVAEVSDEAVRIVMHGACSGCPGSSATMENLVRQAVNRRWPHLVVTADGETTRPALLRLRVGGGRSSNVDPGPMDQPDHVVCGDPMSLITSESTASKSSTGTSPR